MRLFQRMVACAGWLTLTRMCKCTARSWWAVPLDLHVVLTLILDVQEQDKIIGEDKIRKVLDLLHHDICTDYYSHSRRSAAIV